MHIFLNDAKGSYGMYSRAGKNSAEKFNILMKKDEILSGNIRKMYIPSRFDADEKRFNDDEEGPDIFAVDSNKKDTDLNKEENSKLIKKNKKFKNSSFLERKVNSIFRKKYENPPCTRYNPKYEYIWHKSPSGLDWDKSAKRFLTKKNDLEKIEPEKTIEIKTEKSEIKENENKKVIKGRNYINFEKILPRENDLQYNHYKNKTKVSDDLNKTNTIRSTNFFTQENVKGNNFSPSITQEKSWTSKMVFQKSMKKYQKLQAPDFQKIISREQYEKAHSHKKTVVPFYVPNLKPTIPRPIVLVQYDKMLDRKNMERKNILEPIYDMKRLNEIRQNYQKENLNKTDGFEQSKYLKNNAPNFKLTTSRPNDDGPLPSYMKKVFFRQPAQMLTENSLKLNNFKNAQFMNTTSSFWPKKTFNKVINYNLMKSINFKEGLGIENDLTEKNETDNYLLSSMKFYNKNFDDVMKESTLNQFDNVTLKSFEKKRRIDSVELQRFILSTEKSD